MRPGWSVSRTSRGFSLVEALVVFTLLGILSYLFVWILVPSMQFTAQGAARVDVQQLSVLCANRIARDLQQKSAKGAISLYDRSQADPLGEPVVLGMVVYGDVNQLGRRLWEPRVLSYYWDRSAKEVYARAWPPTPPAALSVDPLPTDRPTELESGDLLALAQGGRPVAKRVVEFDARWLDAEAKSAVILEISVEQDVAGKRAPARFDYQRVVALRN